MARDINTKKLKKNAFRYSKVRGETASRIRIPGGVINAKSMAKIAEVAETYGNGTIFVTNRQGVELPGIALEDMPAVNKAIQSIIDDSGVNLSGIRNKKRGRMSGVQAVSVRVL